MTTEPVPPILADLQGKRVHVLGLGRAGRAAARFLLHRGARVLGYDESRQVLTSREVSMLVDRGLRIERPGRVRMDWAVVSPGISDENPLVAMLRRLGVPVVDEMDLASLFVPGDIIAVTGTNGKSTTATLVALMLERARKRVFCGGNLAPGRPLSASLLEPAKDYYVVEASSFQLGRCTWFRPRVALILNITPDHLNRHGSMVRYADSKSRILDRQQVCDDAVLNHDDPLVRKLLNRGHGRKHWFSGRRCASGAYLSRGSLWLLGRCVMKAADIGIVGGYNVLNALAAICAADLLGVPVAAMREVLRKFQGIEHRLERVRRLQGVLYVNNTITTNPASGQSSLVAMAEHASATGKGASPRVVLIAGGREKDLPNHSYVRAMARYARWVVLNGENSSGLAARLRRLGFERFGIAPDLRSAVAMARGKASPGDTVLFSPGFASFDQFRDFQHRGREFKRVVRMLRREGIRSRSD